MTRRTLPCQSYISQATTHRQGSFPFLAQGSFVLGDRTVAAATPATQVNWWGAQWGKMNNVTNEPNTGSFKGFANMTTLAPPAHGGSWSTSTGNRTLLLVCWAA